jgi:hypothetical protein
MDYSYLQNYLLTFNILALIVTINGLKLINTAPQQGLIKFQFYKECRQSTAFCFLLIKSVSPSRPRVFGESWASTSRKCKQGEPYICFLICIRFIYLFLHMFMQLSCASLQINFTLLLVKLLRNYSIGRSEQKDNLFILVQNPLSKSVQTKYEDKKR